MFLLHCRFSAAVVGENTVRLDINHYSLSGLKGDKEQLVEGG